MYEPRTGQTAMLDRAPAATRESKISVAIARLMSAVTQCEENVGRLVTSVEPVLNHDPRAASVEKGQSGNGSCNLASTINEICDRIDKLTDYVSDAVQRCEL